MTSSDLITYLKKIDPDGNLTIVNDDGKPITVIRTCLTYNSYKIKIGVDDSIMRLNFPWLFEKE
jgi:hypothetical protein